MTATEKMDFIEETAKAKFLEMKRESGMPAVTDRDEKLIRLGFELGFKYGALWGSEVTRQAVGEIIDDLNEEES